MSYGPRPWQQTHWDARAAGNFIGGGAGSGLVVFAALAEGPVALPMLLGAALVGLGLLSVWLEIGRPRRAINVFINPGTSWMAREAYVGAALLPCTLAAAAGVPGMALVAGVLALAYAICQGRILMAAKGIPAWRESALLPVIQTTALAEGGGLYWLLAATSAPRPQILWLFFGGAVLGRWLMWRAWRTRLQGSAVAPPALKAIDAAGKPLLYVGSMVPVVAVGLVAMGVPGAPVLAALGGITAFAGGAWFKYTLITRAAYNQGFTLTRLPVRGVRRNERGDR